jgi:hypothetical protein
MWWIFANLGPSLRAFGRSERGAAATRTGFVLAATFGVAVVALSLMFGGGRAAPAPVTVSPVDSAVAELMALPIRTFTETQTRVRLERHLDPAQRTNAQLRNAHRTWARRVAEGTYVDPDLAADMRAITAAALRLRGLSPHPDA